MSTKKYIFSLLFKFVIVFVTFYGVLLNSGYPKTFSPQMFLYYTILSNVLCLVYFFILLCKNIFERITNRRINESKVNMRIKGAVLMAIIVTMIIYWFVLLPAGFIMGEGSTMVANLIVHLIVPSMVILDWLLFDSKGKITKVDPVYWLIIPLSYYAFTVLGHFFNVTYVDGRHYPYFFIDSDILGWSTVGINVVLLVFVFLFIGYIIYFIDKKLGGNLASDKSRKSI